MTQREIPNWDWVSRRYIGTCRLCHADDADAENARRQVQDELLALRVDQALRVRVVPHAVLDEMAIGRYPKGERTSLNGRPAPRRTP